MDRPSYAERSSPFKGGRTGGGWVHVPPKAADPIPAPTLPLKGREFLLISSCFTPSRDPPVAYRVSPQTLLVPRLGIPGNHFHTRLVVILITGVRHAGFVVALA